MAPRFLSALAALALMAGAAAVQTAAPKPNAPLEKAVGEVIKPGPVALFIEAG